MRAMHAQRSLQHDIGGDDTEAFTKMRTMLAIGGAVNRATLFSNRIEQASRVRHNAQHNISVFEPKPPGVIVQYRRQCGPLITPGRSTIRLREREWPQDSSGTSGLHGSTRASTDGVALFIRRWLLMTLVKARRGYGSSWSRAGSLTGLSPYRRRR